MKCRKIQCGKEVVKGDATTTMITKTIVRSGTLASGQLRYSQLQMHMAGDGATTDCQMKMLPQLVHWLSLFFTAQVGNRVGKEKQAMECMSIAC